MIAPAPRLLVFSGVDRRDVLAAVDADRQGLGGPACLAVVSEEGNTIPAVARHWLAEGGVTPPRVHYRDQPVGGETAFVYTNGSAADPVPGGGVLDRIQAATALAVSHTVLTRSVGLTPQAAIGYSSGESTALIALGAWRDADALYRDAHDSGLFTHDLTGELRVVRRAWAALGVPGDRWATYLVTLPADRVWAELAGERAVHLLAVNAPEVCVIGGEARACADVVRRFGAAIPMDFDLAAHAPELAAIRDRWRALHLRPTTPVPGIRFYSGASTEWYTPIAETAADAMTAQALGTVDFAGTVDRAWADGVRVFVEHGPRGLCTGWIRRVLAGREHVAFALDAGPGNETRQLHDAVAALVAAGVPVRTDRVFGEARLADTPVRVQVRRDPGPPVTMPRAPELPPVAAQRAAVPTPVGGGPSATGRATLIAAHRARVTAVHHEVIGLHIAAHRAFLAAGQAAVATLRRPAVPVPSPALSFDRAQLEHLATGRISDLFGSVFSAQDDHVRQTRVPAPPMLLIDRVVRVDAELAALTRSGAATGSMRAETDVRVDSWFLDSTGRMCAALLFEAAGQVVPLLACLLGIDLLHGGDRAFRLLGCALTYYGPAPQVGETLCYDVRIDRVVRHDGKTLVLFQVDGFVGDERRIGIRDGQAGLFTDAELDAAAGVRWSPAHVTLTDDHVVASPTVRCTRRAFTAEQVRAFADGRPADCFGPGWEWTRSHVRSPRIDASMPLLHEVTDFDPAGGPWGRGYLRAQASIRPDSWYFDGHLPHDPCMPALVMLQGGLQAMAFHLAAMGFTVERDGWRFTPGVDHPSVMRCRAQTTPRNEQVVYEVFVRAVHADPLPTLYADLLVSVDGVKALHLADVSLRLIPDHPLTHWRHLGPPRIQTTGEPVALRELGGLVGHRDRADVATIARTSLDYAAILGYAWGDVSEWAGAEFGPHDTRYVARLPGPPFLFVTRVTELDAEFGGMCSGVSVVVEYDVPDEVWYFEQNDAQVMPLSVLMEVALQPCGWLAGYVTGEHNIGLRYRNLDGTGTVTGEVTPVTKTVRTHVELVSLVRMGGAILTTFEIRCSADEALVFTARSTFGFFSEGALTEQRGLPVTDADQRRIDALSDHLADLRTGALPGMPGPMLLMLDRVTGYWPDGGAAGLGALRAETDVDPDAWYFKAHFFTDPVQPGSLGVEAMTQLLRYHLISRGLDPRHSRFEPVLPGRELTWKYRGQVTPGHRLVRVEVEIREAGSDARGHYVVGDAQLWCGDLRIYEVTGLGVRAVIEHEPVPAVVEHVLDPNIDTWVRSHTPTWTVPVLPLVSVLDRLTDATAAYTGGEVVGVRDLVLHRWLPVTAPLRLRTEVAAGPDGVTARLFTPRTSGPGFEEVARAVVLAGGSRPARPEPLPLPDDLELQPDIYESAQQFHGPEFHYLTSWWLSSAGARSVLDLSRGTVPHGHLNQGMLDAALQTVPSFALHRWTPAATGRIAVPREVVELELFEPLPGEGKAEVRVRWAGFRDRGEIFPTFEIQLLVGGRVAARMRQISVLVPSPLHARYGPRQLREFVLRRSIEPVGPARSEDDRTMLTTGDLAALERLPGTTAAVYGLPTSRADDHLELLAVKEHVGRLVGVHPSAVTVSGDFRVATVPGDPRSHQVDVVRTGDTVTVRSAGGRT